RLCSSFQYARCEILIESVPYTDTVLANIYEKMGANVIWERDSNRQPIETARRYWTKALEFQQQLEEETMLAKEVCKNVEKLNTLFETASLADLKTKALLILIEKGSDWRAG